MSNWKHQAHEFKIGRDKKARALLWSMRTGKSKAVIDKTDYQYKHGRIEAALVIAPNGVHINWTKNEIPKWCQSPYSTFAWSTPKRADPEVKAAWEKFIGDPFKLRWLAINMEALNQPDCQAALREFLASCGRKFHLIVSEAHHFGRPGAKRTRLARGLAKHATFRTIETGTVILNSPLRAFSIYEILQPMALGYEKYGPFVSHFAEWVMEKKPGHWKARPKLKGYKNMDELRQKISMFSSVVLREDVEDMPELIRIDRPVVMSDLQRRAYLELVNRHMLEIEGEDDIAALDGGARVQKLQQIVNGYIKDTKLNKIIEIDPDAPIYDALLEQVGGTLPGKSIIWCRFREDIRRCVEKLKQAGYKVLEYHGGVPTEKREDVRLAFQNDPAYTVMVGQPIAGGEGRDFSAADAVIFFSGTPDAKAIAQAEERATIKGGKPVSIIRLRTYGTIDDRVWDIVEGKITLADTVSGSGLRDVLLQTDV